MCCKSWKTLIPFFLTFICGVLIATYLLELRTAKSIYEPFYNNGGVSERKNGNDLNCFACRDGHIEKKVSKIEETNDSIKDKAVQTPLIITYKPKAQYTDEARENETQGTVSLRVTFLANGTIGGITPVSTLPNGLTESSIEAARKIAFHPATRNGKPISVTKTLQFTFTIY